MEIRLLTANDAGAFWTLRLEALESEPYAFGQSVEEHRATTVEETRARLLSNSAHTNFIAGAFADGVLIGSAGFSRNPEAKRKHKGILWGFYVSKPWRGHGIGQALLKELITLARAQTGLEKIVLTVNIGQSAAKRLYSSLGFQTFGHESRALKVGGVYVDEDQMVLELS